MPVIWKYDLSEVERLTYVDIPGLIQVLSVGTQDDQPVVWVMCQPKEPTKRYLFWYAQTGRPFDPDKGLKYINTTQHMGGLYVAHWFYMRV